MSWRACFRSVCCHVDMVTVLPSLARGMLDSITRRIGLTVGKGPPFAYMPSWVPTLEVSDGTRLVLYLVSWVFVGEVFVLAWWCLSLILLGGGLRLVFEFSWVGCCWGFIWWYPLWVIGQLCFGIERVFFLPSLWWRWCLFVDMRCLTF